MKWPPFIGVWLVILRFEHYPRNDIESSSKRKITSQTPMNGGNIDLLKARVHASADIGRSLKSIIGTTVVVAVSQLKSSVKSSASMNVGLNIR